MKTFKNITAQGELHIVRIKGLPQDIPALPAIDGRVVVGHSETGHHHVMDAARTG